MEAIGLNNGMETRIGQLDGGDWIGQRDLGNPIGYQTNKAGIQFRPLSRGVKKNGEKFREETSTVQPERSGGRLLVF
jgi:hypothetical protein